MYGEVHLWAYTNQALFCINMAENGNCPSTFEGTFHMKFQQNLCKDVSDTRKSPGRSQSQPGFIMVSYSWNLGMHNKFSGDFYFRIL